MNEWWDVSGRWIKLTGVRGGKDILVNWDYVMIAEHNDWMDEASLNPCTRILVSGGHQVFVRESFDQISRVLKTAGE